MTQTLIWPTFPVTRSKRLTGVARQAPYRGRLARRAGTIPMHARGVKPFGLLCASGKAAADRTLARLKRIGRSLRSGQETESSEMPLPIIPILAIAAMAGGGISLGWYYRLSEDEKRAADKKASELVVVAGKIAVDTLSKSEAKSIIEEVEHEFA
jgi:hypothetical protein